MEQYKNLSDLSKVTGYESGDDFIIVEFEKNPDYTHTTYKYTYDSAGRGNVEKMKELAQDGWGLNSYINAKARDLYEEAVK